MACTGDKYEVLMVDDPQADDLDGRGEARIAFQVSRSLSWQHTNT